MENLLSKLADYVFCFDKKGKLKDGNPALLEWLNVNHSGKIVSELEIFDLFDFPIEQQLNDFLINQKNIILDAILAESKSENNQCVYTVSLHWNEDENTGVGLLTKKQDSKSYHTPESELDLNISLMKGRMAEGMYNEFRNVLGLVSGYTEMALDSLKNGSTNIQNDLDEIIKGCKRGREILDKATLLAKNSENYPIYVEADRFLNEIAQSSKIFVPKNVIIEIETEKIISKLFIDPIKLHQLILSIILEIVYKLNRSLKYIHLKLIISRIRYNINNNSNLGEFASFVVSYRKEKEALDRKPVKEGRLYQSYLKKDIMENLSAQMGIFIELKENEDEISVNIIIPVSGSPHSDPVPKYTGPPRGNGECILIVDDEEAVAEVTKRRLEKLGYNVKIRTNPVEALDYLKDPDVEADLLITDQIMPEMTGLQLVQKVKEVREDQRIIMMTGYASGITHAVCKKYGISGLAMKPLDEGELAVIVANELRR